MTKRSDSTDTTRVGQFLADSSRFPLLTVGVPQRLESTTRKEALAKDICVLRKVQ